MTRALASLFASFDGKTAQYSQKGQNIVSFYRSMFKVSILILQQMQHPPRTLRRCSYHTRPMIPDTTLNDT